MRLQLGRAGLDIRRAWSPPSYPTSAHLTVPSTWSGGLGHRKGTESSKLPDPSSLFCAINPDNLSGIEPFHEDRPLDSFDEEDGWMDKSSSPDREIFMVFIEEITFTDATHRRLLQLARTLSNPPTTTSTIQLA
jgi:hypothetical protein